MEQLTGVLGILIIFGLIIFVHEFGHFIVAKLSGMAVYEFALGFGPRVISRKYKDTIYAIRMLPIGGFVNIAGMDPEEVEKKVPNGFNEKSLFARFATIIAGVTMNLILALVVLIVMGAAIGYPKVSDKAMIGGVFPGSPAAKAGVQPGDAILAVNDKQNPTLDEAVKEIKSGPDTVRMVVGRSGKQFSYQIPRMTVHGLKRRGLIYYQEDYRGIGIAPDYRIIGFERMGLGKAIVIGVNNVIARLVDAFAQFLSMVTGHISWRMVSGPVGIMQVSYSFSQDAFSSIFGLWKFLNLLVIISVALAFFNVLPLPALDGGHLFFILVEGIVRKPLDQRKIAVVHAVGLFILLGLIAVITVKDILSWAGVIR